MQKVDLLTPAALKVSQRISEEPTDAANLQQSMLGLYVVCTYSDGIVIPMR